MFEKVITTLFHAKPEAGSQVSAVDPRQPDGYAYRYPDGIRFETGGRSINGSEPLESIPYYFGTPAPGEKVVAPGSPDLSGLQFPATVFVVPEAAPAPVVQKPMPLVDDMRENLPPRTPAEIAELLKYETPEMTARYDVGSLENCWT